MTTDSALHHSLNAMGHFLRAPHHRAMPEGLPSRGLRVYGDLLFNNIYQFIHACFPVSRQILGESRWRGLTKAFFREWSGQTPWFREVPLEFVGYVLSVAEQRRLPAWLPELVHYEWAELAVDIMDCPVPAHQAGDLLTAPIVCNPALMNLAYTWPVQRIGPDWRPRRPEATCLAVYRNQEDEVRFTLLNPASARLLEICRSGTLTGTQALLQLAQEMGHPQPEAILQFGAQELRTFFEQGLILGVQA